MKFIADFHIHSKYSRATSSDMNLENLEKWAKIKGIKVLGSGDFTHPEWFKNLKENLEPAESGLYKLKNSRSDIRFLLTSEVSCIYSKKGKVRKIHILLFAPDLKTVEKINAHLGWIGNLKSDGRPILGLDAKELTKIVLNTSENCLVVPAHCLPPSAFLHSSNGIKAIKDFSVGDKVYTHKGRLKKVKKVYKRFYKGKVYNIKPYYFGIGLTTTPEHPFYATKARDKNWRNFKKDFKRDFKQNCFKKCRPQWIQAKDLNKGDVLVFPRFNKKFKDVKEIKLSDYLSKKPSNFVKSKIISREEADKKIFNKIKVDKEFCRLTGCYLSRGRTDNQNSVSFYFNCSEKKYISDLELLMNKVFNFSLPGVYKKRNAKSAEVVYSSKILAQFFSNFFYSQSAVKDAGGGFAKSLPVWMLDLPLEKQAEIFKGWWTGSKGIVFSRELMNQIKIILLRLGIIPSICRQKKKKDKAGGSDGGFFRLNQLVFFQDLFNLLETPEFKKFKTKISQRYGWIDEKYIYLPIKEIKIENYRGEVYNLEVEGDNSYLGECAAVHNCWTPWFSLFGSRSGFDSLEECFEEYSEYIYAGETGLSADPEMFWRVPDCRRLALISNSDAHSPQKLGREANVFDIELSYPSIVEAIKSKNPLKFLYTIEFFPEEGKYHYDGHRNCGISCSPSQTRKYNGVCPVCGRPLTIGVMSRVEELADQPEGFKPKEVVPFKTLVPLKEIIADVLGVGVQTKQVEQEYENLIREFGSEFEVLLNVSYDDLKSVVLPEIAEGIIRVRQGKVQLEPGYDGVFGKVMIFPPEKKRKNLPKQKTLF